MANITYPNTFVAGQPARASEVNANFAAVATQVNGNIETANLATDAVTTVKIADDAVVTAKIADANITNAKIDSIDAAKLTTGTLPIERIDDGGVTPAKTSFFDTMGASGKIFGGRIAMGGTIVRAPAGWVSTKAATGTYQITHNIGSTDYLIVATPDASVPTYASSISTLTKGTAAVYLGTFDSSGVATDIAFDFIIVAY